MANHKDTEIYFNGAPMVVKRGQMVTSLEKLSERWGWSKKKTRLFLGTLKGTGMVLTEGHAKGTILTLVNYDNFQGQGHTKGHTEGHTEGHAEGTQTRIYKNDIKNSKNRARVQIEQHEYDFDDITRKLAARQGELQ